MKFNFINKTFQENYLINYAIKVKAQLSILNIQITAQSKLRTKL
jgi:hypothetical protein